MVGYVACGQSPLRGVLSTQKTPDDDEELLVYVVRSVLPTSAPAVPATLVSASPIVAAGDESKAAVTTFAGSTIESESLCHAEARATPSSRLSAAAASTANSNFLCMFSPLGGLGGHHLPSINRCASKPD